MKFTQFHERIAECHENYYEADSADIRIIDADGFIHQVERVLFDSQEHTFFIRVIPED